MLKSVLRNSIDDMRDAARQGAQIVREMLGQSNDPDLRLYEKLTTSDFVEIGRLYGEDELRRYIRLMETRRLKEKRHA